VKIEKVSEVLSPLYDLGYTEEELKTKWKKYYKF
jgi:DNA-binding transcriptional ArsR family regulator